MTVKYIRHFIHESSILKNNPLKDPSKRSLYVFEPKGTETSTPLPALLQLSGFGGTGASQLNFDPFEESLTDKYQRLIDENRCSPFRVIFPDCFTKVGGSQYINSTAIGNYEDYLVKEIVPYIESQYRVSDWGIFGKSSGGYGAMIQAMHHPEIFKVVANHSGDSAFELTMIPEFKAALNSFQKAGGVTNWLEKFWTSRAPHQQWGHSALLVLGLSAAWSPNPECELGIEFPFDLNTGVFKASVWKKWSDWDPVNRVKFYIPALQSLKGIYIDCGKQDEYGLHFGARALKAELVRLGIKCAYEEFEGTHRSISWRQESSIPFMVKALTKS